MDWKRNEMLAITSQDIFSRKVGVKGQVSNNMSGIF
jgi:hypothetical protein